MPQPTSPKRGFRLACPKCGDGEDQIFIYLNDLTHAVCADCDETFSVEEAADHFVNVAAAWQRAVEWIKLAPMEEGT